MPWSAGVGACCTCVDRLDSPVVARVRFTSNLARHVDAGEITAPGATVRAVLDAAFAQRPRARGYVLDEQGVLRKHVNLFVDGVQVRDRNGLSDGVGSDSVIDVLQALSGG